MKIKLNVPLIISVSFFIEQNIYFGWNLLPKTDIEIICDGVSMILFSLCAQGEK